MKCQKDGDLFYALTYYHLLCILVYVMNHGRRENNTIIISKETVNHETIIANLRKTGLFQQVIVIDDRKILDQGPHKSCYTDDEIKEIIKEKAYAVKKELPLDVKKFERIFICADHFPIGIYLNYFKIKYFYFEDGAGQQSICDTTIEKSIKPCDMQLYFIIEQLKLFGRNKNVRYCYVNKHCQQKKIHLKEIVKYRNFNVVKELLKLRQDQKNLILKVFNSTEKIKLNSDCALFLPVNNVRNGILTRREQKQQITILMDYFSEGHHPVIKAHPNDSTTDYKSISGALVLNNQFPAELLTLFIDGKIGRLVSTWSTTLNSLDDLAEEKICVGSEMDSNYLNLNWYYVILSLVSYLTNDFGKFSAEKLDWHVLRTLIKYSEFPAIGGGIKEIKKIFYKDEMYGTENLTDKIYIVEKENVKKINLLLNSADNLRRVLQIELEENTGRKLVKRYYIYSEYCCAGLLDSFYVEKKLTYSQSHLWAKISEY